MKEYLSVSISGEDGKRRAIVNYNYNGDLGHIIEYDDHGETNTTGHRIYEPGTFTNPIGENLDERKRHADNMEKNMASFLEILKEKCDNNKE